ncbi:MAG: 3-hydroxyacyl-[acyl-carrier-protein] dehydratase FabZ [Planctomycetota bacterium]
MRYVLVDRFLELSAGERARAVKCVTRGEPFLRDLPFFPSPLVLEALLQTGGALTRVSAGGAAMSVLGKVNRASFPGRARPGDRIDLEVTVALSRPEGTLCEGTATVDGTTIARAEFMIVLLPPELTPEPDPARDEQRRLLADALGVSQAIQENRA